MGSRTRTRYLALARVDLVSVYHLSRDGAAIEGIEDAGARRRLLDAYDARSVFRVTPTPETLRLLERHRHRFVPDRLGFSIAALASDRRSLVPLADDEVLRFAVDLMDAGSSHLHELRPQGTGRGIYLLRNVRTTLTPVAEGAAVSLTAPLPAFDPARAYFLGDTVRVASDSIQTRLMAPADFDSDDFEADATVPPGWLVNATAPVAATVEGLSSADWRLHADRHLTIRLDQPQKRVSVLWPDANDRIDVFESKEAFDVITLDTSELEGDQRFRIRDGDGSAVALRDEPPHLDGFHRAYVQPLGGRPLAVIELDAVRLPDVLEEPNGTSNQVRYGVRLPAQASHWRYLLRKPLANDINLTAGFDFDRGDRARVITTVPRPVGHWTAEIDGFLEDSRVSAPSPQAHAAFERQRRRFVTDVHLNI